MFLILNRLRGTEGLWSKIIGLFLALLAQIAFDNVYVTMAVGLGYIIGESFGWGLWVGAVTTTRESHPNKAEEEGKNNGIMWIARKLIPNYLTDGFLNYCRLALFIRGIYWWAVPLGALYFAGVNIYVLLGCLLFLAVGFPVACELGYRLSKYISMFYNKKTKQYEIYLNGKLAKTINKEINFSVSGGWELSEVLVGIEQDIVFIVILIAVCIGA